MDASGQPQFPVDPNDSPHTRERQILAVTTEEIVSCYVEDRGTVTEVAERLGISVSTVCRHLRKAGVNTRPRTSLSDEVLRARYAVAGESARSIAGIYGLAPASVHRRLRRIGIAPREQGHRRRLALLSTDWLVEQYALGQSTYDIASNLGCDPKTVYRKLVDAGAQLRPRGENLAGDDNYMATPGVVNPNYKDGSSSERDCMKATKRYKELLRAVYARDDYTCARCGCRGSGAGQLNAHHRRAWAGNREARFDADNLVTLCRRCHEWVHSNANVDHMFVVR